MGFIDVEVEQETSAPPPKKLLDPPLLLVSWVTIKKLECLEFITYEVVARSRVASRPNKNAPLAKKLLRSTCL